MNKEIKTTVTFGVKQPGDEQFEDAVARASHESRMGSIPDGKDLEIIGRMGGQLEPNKPVDIIGQASEVVRSKQWMIDNMNA